MLPADILLVRPAAYRHACESPRAGLVVAAILCASGVVYGILVALFQRAIGVEIQGFPVEQISDTVLIGGNVLSGLITAVAVHAGMTMIAWLMARAVGGPGLLIGIYRTTAYLLPLGWLALPQLAVTVAAAGHPTPALPLEWAYVPLAAIGLALVFAGLFQIYLLTQDKGPVRSGIAVVLFALFTASVLLVF